MGKGKGKAKGEYNDFLDGEKLRDNTEIRTSLQAPPPSSTNPNISPPPLTRTNPNPQSTPLTTSKPPAGKSDAKKAPLTHFLCFPLVDEQTRSSLEQGLMKLREEVEKEGLVSMKAVRPVGTLHLTLGVMSLDEEKLQEAIDHLQSLDLRTWLTDIVPKSPPSTSIASKSTSASIPASALDSGSETPHSIAPLSIQLKGLVPMHQPSKTSILYADPVDASERLYPFAERIRQSFMDKGFIINENRALRLHATVLNTVYVKSAMKGKGRGRDSKSWMQIDARDLIEAFEGYVWGEVGIGRVGICRMGARKIMGEGGEVVGEEYEVVAERGI